MRKSRKRWESSSRDNPMNKTQKLQRILVELGKLRVQTYDPTTMGMIDELVEDVRSKIGDPSVSDMDMVDDSVESIWKQMREL